MYRPNLKSVALPVRDITAINVLGRVGRPRQSWLRTVEADLRPMNLGLATSKWRAQDRSAWCKLVTTATSTTGSRRRREEWGCEPESWGRGDRIGVGNGAARKSVDEFL